MDAVIFKTSTFVVNSLENTEIDISSMLLFDMKKFRVENGFFLRFFYLNYKIIYIFFLRNFGKE